MSKVLTISIAAYNMEKYIDQCIESLLDERIIDDLEIFVIDDGGKDRTLEIARQYAEKYPDSIFPIHKENGGWGSTVNYSISNAAGKYFKILDGDDWFDKDGLFELIKAIRETNVDIVVTPNHRFNDKTYVRTEHISGYDNGRVQSIDSVDINATCIGMWATTVRTETAKQIGFQLPLHMLYTDTLFIQGILAKSKTVLYVNSPVYCYRQSRPGQSTSVESMKKHYQEQIYVAQKTTELYNNQKSMAGEALAAMCKRAVFTQYWVYKGIICLYEPKRVVREIKEYDEKLKELSEDIYKAVVSVNNKASKILSFLRMTKFFPLWFIKLIPKKMLSRLLFKT